MFRPGRSPRSPRLREFGIDRALLPQVAQKVMEERGVYFNPLPVRGPEAVQRLLEEAW